MSWSSKESWELSCEATKWDTMCVHVGDSKLDSVGLFSFQVHLHKRKENLLSCDWSGVPSLAERAGRPGWETLHDSVFTTSLQLRCQKQNSSFKTRGEHFHILLSSRTQSSNLMNAEMSCVLTAACVPHKPPRQQENKLHLLFFQVGRCGLLPTSFSCGCH